MYLSTELETIENIKERKKYYSNYYYKFFTIKKYKFAQNLCNPNKLLAFPFKCNFILNIACFCFIVRF